MPRTRHRILQPLLDLEEFLISGRPCELGITDSRLVPCWRELGCTKKRCPAYGRPGLRCWQMHGTFCQPGKARPDIVRKWRDCRRCRVFRAATATPVARMEEALANIYFMMRGHRQARQDILLSANVARAVKRYGLTPRQAQALIYLLNRHDRDHMAGEFSVSPETVKTHVRHIYRKTGVHSRKELIARLQRDCAAPRRSRRRRC